jgi:hypothetical protein
MGAVPSIWTSNGVHSVVLSDPARTVMAPREAAVLRVLVQHRRRPPALAGKRRLSANSVGSSAQILHW